ncbi:MAG: T9SS type A sorting domain-containing protein [Ignavibacteria bacterium]|nr:T9SS type A sorting domain-containing protein [Ignavibacteria bacterium]
MNFDLSIKSEVKIELFDISGRLVKEIENSFLLPGNYPYYQNAENFNSGIYFLRFKVNESIRTEKIVLIK